MIVIIIMMIIIAIVIITKPYIEMMGSPITKSGFGSWQGNRLTGRRLNLEGHQNVLGLRDAGPSDPVG